MSDPTQPATKLRIVQYLKDVRWSIGGVTRAVLDSSRVLAERGHDVRLITCDPTDVPPTWLADHDDALPHVTVTRCSALQLIRGTELPALAELIAAADVLHLHAPWTISNLQLARIARRENCPYVLTIHGMLDDWSMSQHAWKKKLYLRWLGRDLLDQAAAIHCTAEAERQQAEKHFNNPNVAVLPYLFDLSELRSLPGPELARQSFPQLATPLPRVLFLSRLHIKKGIEPLIVAASELKKRGFDTHLFVAGDGDADYTQRLIQRVDQLQLADRVTFVGLVKGAVKLSLYQACDLFVLPTSQENFGLVLPESLACSTPVITTRGVDIWQELAAAGAIIIDDTHPNTIADAIQNALSDRTRLAELGRRGREWVMTALDPSRLAVGFESLYSGLIRK